MQRKIIAILIMGLFLLVNLPGASAWAAETATIELTLDQAISKAVSHSRTLKSANIDIDVADENAGDARSQWRASYAIEYVDITPSIETRYTNLLNQDYNYDSAVTNRDIQEDAVRAQARSSYYDLLQAIDSLALKKSSLQTQQNSFKISQAYYDVGMLSSVELNQAKIDLTQKQVEVTNAEYALNNSYISFNELVGLKLEDRPILTSTPAMEILEVADVPAQISLIMSDSPSLDLVDAALDMKEELIGVTGYTESANEQLKQAEMNAETTKESVRKSLYSVYYSTKNLEDSYTTARKNLDQAQLNLRIAQLKNALGMNTKSDVISAENAVLQAQSSLLTIKCNHDILKETFYKPWAA